MNGGWRSVRRMDGEFLEMKEKLTEKELQQMLEGLRAAFDAVTLTELDPESAHHWRDNGVQVDYELRAGQVGCMLTRWIEVEGKHYRLQMCAPLAGNVLPEDRMTEREREMCRDDMNHDFLTGVFNRRYLEQVFRASLDELSARGGKAAAALVSLDHYAELRMQYGQPVVDQLVSYMANQWKKHFEKPGQRLVGRLTDSVLVVACAGCTGPELEAQMGSLYAGMPRDCVIGTGMMSRLPFTLTIACAGIEELKEGEKNWDSLYRLCDCRMRERLKAKKERQD